MLTNMALLSIHMNGLLGTWVASSIPLVSQARNSMQPYTLMRILSKRRLEGQLNEKCREPKKIATLPNETKRRCSLSMHTFLIDSRLNVC